ncbi:MAG: signal peptidase II [Pseudomonadota bacterium]
MKALWGTAVGILAVDQTSKYWIVEALGLKDIGRIDVMSPYLTFVMAWNQGINFGLGASGADWMRWALIALALAICIAVYFWAARKGTTGFLVGGGLVIGGAIGNVIDRIQYGAVADFLNMSCCGIHNPYAFNVADIAIFAGAALLILQPSEQKKTG